MKFTLLFAFLTSTTLLSAQTAPAEAKMLFERLGGTSGVTAIGDDVIEAYMSNPAINA